MASKYPVSRNIMFQKDMHHDITCMLHMIIVKKNNWQLKLQRESDANENMSDS